MKVQDVLDEASRTVLGHRAAEYGENSYTPVHIRIAQVWSGILDREITPNEVALCMAGLKLVRAAQKPGHLDSYVDGIGYLAIAADLTEAAAPAAPPSPIPEERSRKQHLKIEEEEVSEFLAMRKKFGISEPMDSLEEYKRRRKSNYQDRQDHPVQP